MHALCVICLGVEHTWLALERAYCDRFTVKKFCLEVLPPLVSKVFTFITQVEV